MSARWIPYPRWFTHYSDGVWLCTVGTKRGKRRQIALVELKLGEWLDLPSNMRVIATTPIPVPYDGPMPKDPR